MEKDNASKHCFGFVLGLGLLGLIPAQVLAGEKVVLTTLDWPPYIGQNVDGKNRKGYVYDVVKEAFKRAGYELDIKFFPWARTVEEAKNGNADGYFPEYEVHELWAALSDSFPGGPVGLYKRKDLNIKYEVDPKGDNQTKALESLKKYTFGIVKGYTNTTAFDNASFLKKEEAASDEVNLKKLYGKRIDFVFIDKFVAKSITAGPEFKGYDAVLEFMEPSLEDKPLYINFSKKAKDHEKKLNDFNASLKAMKEDGSLQKIMSEYGF
ncbi:MAG: substrate-binding periplasmic protein [Gammaproteobacteria bacterium]